VRLGSGCCTDRTRKKEGKKERKKERGLFDEVGFV
jgi:hypothetical protein